MKSYRSVLGIVNDILDMTKISEGQFSINIEPSNLTSLVEHICSDFMILAQHKNIILSYHIDENIGQKYRQFDSLRLGQVLRNLMSNAIKFTDSGGVDVSVDVGANHDQVRIQVRDSGIGIPADKLSLIFDPFEQVGLLRSVEQQGTGLGLSISKRLIELMDGSIEVSSEVGKGTTFTIELPLPIVSYTSQMQHQAGMDISRAARILLVEDSVTNQVIFKALLANKGLHVDVADNGKSGVEMALQSHYDVVFMDINLPIMNGMEAIAILKEAGYQRPLIACTANVLKHDVDAYYSAGFDGVVGKPYLLNDLIIHIHASLDDM